MNETILAEVQQFPGRSTRAVIDLDAIEGNVRTVRTLAGVGVEIMAVVKANGYGHGAIGVSEAALVAGATRLGVATVDEGMQLRTAGIDAPIVVLGPVDPSELEIAIRSRLQLSVGDVETVDAVTEASARLGSDDPVALHLKIDTGMHRFGCDPEEAAAIASTIVGRPSLWFAGVFSHFARADERSEPPTNKQRERFEHVLATLAERGLSPSTVHSANSAAALRSSENHHHMMRLGIALYGLDPSPDVPCLPGMRPAMTIVSRLRRVGWLEPGEAVSYGGTYVAGGRERIGLVPIGYGDGYRRAFSNRGWMSVDGERCPVRGRVCMDQTVIGLPESGPAPATGASVIVAGAWHRGGIASLAELGELAGTINYEIATGLGHRVPRFYLRGGTVIAIEDLAGFRRVSPDIATNT